MKRIGVIFAILALTLMVLAVPATAGEKGKAKGKARASAKASEAGQKRGDADNDASTSYTEDDDTNDGDTPNNVPDDGDNAHPSGRDRSVENGGSGNQGSSESDPDDDGRGPDRSNGGPDKPNGTGGVDVADQDGNNGCGNDDDFEDDNEGWCGKNPKRDGGEVGAQVEEQTTTEVEAETEVQAGTGVETTVEGELLTQPAEGAVGASVLGVRIARGQPNAVAAAGSETRPTGQALPFTGGDVLPLVALGLGLMLVGARFVLRPARVKK